MKKIYRHGDWNFIPAEKIAGEKIKTDNEFTWAVGEARNHNHTAHATDITKMNWYKMPDGSYFVDFKEDIKLTHPEHSTKIDLVVPIGIYKVIQRREKDWFQLTVRKILD